MNFSLRTSTLALTFMLAAAPFVVNNAVAKDNFMTICSAKFKAAKADGSIDAATKWTDFMKTTCKADQAAAPDAAPDATPVVAEKPAKAPKPPKAEKTTAPATAKATTPPAAATDKPVLTKSFIKTCSKAWTDMKANNTVPEGLTWKDFVIGKCTAQPASATTTANATDTTDKTFMEKCSADWKAMKAAKTVPDGLTWKDFVKAKCVAEGVPAPAPVKATTTKKKVASTAPEEPTAVDPSIKLVDKNGKPFTPGQLAAHERARTCGAMWQSEKAKGTLEDGMKWPQYWSKCNTELKAAQ
jgi:hypothetical protein